MHFGTLIHLVHVHKHGMASPLLVNINSIVFMNQRLERVTVFTWDDKQDLNIVLESSLIMEMSINLIKSLSIYRKGAA